jgi:hypothetical protein
MSILVLVERATPCTSKLLVVEMNIPCTSILLVVEMDTLYKITILAAEMDTPCTSIDSCCVLFVLFDIEKSYVNAGMLKKR